MSTVEGVIKLVLDVETFDSGFTKRGIVVTTNDDKYPQDIKLEFLKDGIKKLDGYKTGDNVSIAYSLKGNEYNGKYYVNLNGFAINKVAAEVVGTVPPVVAPVDMNGPSDAADDLPF